jgi:hypothetical protein
MLHFLLHVDCWLNGRLMTVKSATGQLCQKKFCFPRVNRSILENPLQGVPIDRKFIEDRP